VTRGRRRTATLLALGAVLLAPLAFLWPSVLGSATYLPYDPAQFPPFSTTLTPEQLAEVRAGENMDVTEVPVTFWPELLFAREELEQGRLPEWNPYARCGAMLLATGVVGLMYPIGWLTLLARADPARGFGLHAWVGLALAGTLMLGFLRRLGLRPLPALLGALAFAVGGTLAANAHFYQRLHALVWLPGMLWATLAAATCTGRQRALAAAGLALCVMLSALAGFPFYAAISAGIAGAYGLVLAARGGGPRAAATVAGAIALGAAGAAMQLLPMAGFFPESNRDPNPTSDSIGFQAMDPAGLLGYLLPGCLGTPLRPGLAAEQSPFAWWLFSRRSWDTGLPFQPNYSFIEYAVFPGTLPLLLALAALLAGGTRFRWFAAAGVAGLWLLGTCSLGTGPLHDLPVLRSIPPMRFVAPAAALVAALAAIGLDRAPRALGARRAAALAALGGLVAAACALGLWLLRGAEPQELLARMTPALLAHYGPTFPHADEALVREAFGGAMPAALDQMRASLARGAVAFALAAAWVALLPLARRARRGPTAMRAVAVAATAAELLAMAAPLNRSRELPHPLDSPVHAFLREARDAAAPAGGFTVARGAEAPELPLQLPPCLLLRERIRDLHAYTFVDARSHLPLRELYGAGFLIRGYWPMAFPDDERLERPLFDLLGVRFVLSTVPMAHAGRRVGPELAGPGGAFYVHERASALPRAFVVPALRELPDDDAVVAALIARDLAPRAAALVTPDQAALLGPLPEGPPGGAREVTVDAASPDELRVRVAAGAAGYLVVNDVPMRGWSATIDGAPATIARGNLHMAVVQVPPRATEVVLRFATPHLGLGVAVSATAVAVMLGLALGGLRGRRGARTQSTASSSGGTSDPASASR
jgi:hypothetical protein